MRRGAPSWSRAGVGGDRERRREAPPPPHYHSGHSCTLPHRRWLGVVLLAATLTAAEGGGGGGGGTRAASLSLRVRASTVAALALGGALLLRPAQAVVWRHESGEWYIPSIVSNSGETKKTEVRSVPIKGNGFRHGVTHGHAHRHAGANGMDPYALSNQHPEGHHHHNHEGHHQHASSSAQTHSPVHAAHHPHPGHHEAGGTPVVVPQQSSEQILTKAEQLKRHLSVLYPAPSVLTATFATKDMWSFVKNWWHFAAKFHETNQLLVVAMDDELKALCDAAEMAAVGVASFFELRGCEDERLCNAKGVEGFRLQKEAFNAMGQVKVSVLETMLLSGYTVLLSDIDVVWLRDPLDYVVSPTLKKQDVLVSSDCIFNFMRPDQVFGDAYGQLRGVLMAEFNTGVLLVRATAAGQAFVRRWREAIEGSTERRMNDQSHFNVQIKRNFQAYPNPPPFPHAPCSSPAVVPTEDNVDDVNACLFTSRGQEELRVGALPTLHFPNGHIYTVARLPQRMHVVPYAVHCTYQYSGTPGKRSRFRELGLWVDEPEYYSEGRFLALQHQVPPHLIQPKASLATPKGGTPEAHLALVQWQVDMVRNGLALARTLGRTLILPELVCTCDRWFNLLPNCTSGEVTLPFLCPADHIFRLNEWAAKDIAFREHNFLANSALQASPAWRSATYTTLRACAPPGNAHHVYMATGLPSCDLTAKCGHRDAFGAVEPGDEEDCPSLAPDTITAAVDAAASKFVRAGSTDVQLRQQLAAYADVKVLIVVDGIQQMFRGFERDEVRRRAA